MESLPGYEFYSSDDRKVTCHCCGISTVASNTVTRDGLTFCKDSSACCYRKRGLNMVIEYHQNKESAARPLFGD